jgi:hypothetical protein
MVMLRSVFLYILTDLQVPQFPDDPGPQQKTDEKGRQTGINGPEGDITEYIEKRKAGMQRIQQIIQHGSVLFFLLYENVECLIITEYPRCPGEA